MNDQVMAPSFFSSLQLYENKKKVLLPAESLG